MSDTATDNDIRIIIAYSEAALQRLGPKKSEARALPEGMITLGREVLALREKLRDRDTTITDLEPCISMSGKRDLLGGPCDPCAPCERAAQKGRLAIEPRSDFSDVGDFHQKFGLPNATHEPPAPRELTDEETKFRLGFMLEELEEYAAAVGYGMTDQIGEAVQGPRFTKMTGEREVDLPGAADSLVDLCYVTLGTAHLHRLPWAELFAEAQRANMGKERCGIDHTFRGHNPTCDDVAGGCLNGECHEEECLQPREAHSLRGSALDVIKPPDWRPPNIASILEKYGWKP